MNKPMSMHFRVRGFYNCVVIRGDGTREETGWFPNVITNQGLDYIGTSTQTAPNQRAAYDAGGVGTGSTTPTIADTTLTTQLATSTTWASGPAGSLPSATYVAGPPPYWSGINQINFPLGGVIGNITEVGVGHIVSTTLQVFSHALILDIHGNPTTISLGATDTFQLFYEERLYTPTVDVSYSFVMNSVTYSGVVRQADVTNALVGFNLWAMYNSGSLYDIRLYAYNGTIGATTGLPSGASTSISSSNSGTLTLGTYTPGSYTLSFQMFAKLTELNLTGGITAFQFASQTMKYQLSVSPAIPKTNTYTMQLNMAVSWMRY